MTKEHQTANKKKVVIRVTFEVEVNSSVRDDDVFLKYEKKLRETFNTISKIELIKR